MRTSSLTRFHTVENIIIYPERISHSPLLLDPVSDEGGLELRGEGGVFAPARGQQPVGVRHGLTGRGRRRGHLKEKYPGAIVLVP